MKFRQFIWSLGLAFSIAACTQQGAPVEYKGSEYYGHEHEGALDAPNHETFAADSPIIKEGYARPVEPAAVADVGMADLPPPGGTTAAPITPGVSAATGPNQHIYSSPPPFQTATESSKRYASVNEGGKDNSPSEKAPDQKAPDQKAGKFVWPVGGGKIISHFGAKSTGGKPNEGINISVGEGEPIYAAADGTVIYVGSQLEGYGNMVILRHDGGWMTAYAHARTIASKKGDKVKQGAIIGYVGVSGGVKKPQLHFVIRDGDTPVDPEKYLPANVAGQ